jgi:putative ABC transport system permease protein
MQGLIQDLRYGARMLLKRPGFSLVAIITLALGIGANLTIFSFVDTMFLRPLPVREPYQLVTASVGADGGFAYPVYTHFRDHNTSFEALSAHYSTAPLDLATSDGDSQTLNGAVVSANYFSTLGISPTLGRFFSPDEDIVPDRDRVAVISHGFWQSRFGGDKAVLGRQIRLNGKEFTIVGVTPPQFQGVSPGYPNDVWIPTMMVRLGYRWCDALQDLKCHPLESIGRLKPNQSLTSAQAEMATLSSQWAAANPVNKDRGVRLYPALGVRAMDRDSLKYQLRLMMTMTGVLLLIACANVSGLLLNAGAARRKEISVRLCIGAGRFRLIRQFLTESLLLTLAGSGLGLLISVWAKNLLLVYYVAANSNYASYYDLSLNPRTLLFALVLSIGAGVVFAVVPAIQSSRQDLVAALKNESGSQSRRHSWARSMLVVTQISLSLGLLISAGLLIRSAAHIRQGQNFDPQNVVVFRLRPRLRDYAPEKAQAFTKEVLRQLETTPGVQSVSVVKTTLAWPGSGNVRVRLPEQTFAKPEDQLKVPLHEIGPRTFVTLKLPLIQGREFTDDDRPETPRVVIVNQTLAKRMWPEGQPVERTLMINDQPYRVVGAVKDAQFRNVAEAPQPFLYLPYWQNVLTPQIDATILARVSGDPEVMAPILRREIAAVDPNVPISESTTVRKQVDDEFKRVLLTGSVLISSSAIALFLSMIGLYGALAFTVSQRTREIGIRMALGARTADVLKLIVGQGLRLVTAGLVTGVFTAIAATRLMASLLYGVSPTDPFTFITIAAALAGVGVLACWIPARRAARVDPLVALRYE